LPIKPPVDVNAKVKTAQGSQQRMAGTAYSVSGEGFPVVVVHGLGLNRHMWQWQRGALATHFKVVEYDLLGHGESDKPAGAYRMEQMVEQLVVLLDGLEIDRCALLGFSLGGLIVQAFTLAHPGHVAALVILNAAHQRSAEQRAGLMTRVEQARLEGPAATVDAALQRWFSADFGRAHPEVLTQVRGWVIANDAAVYPELYALLAQADIGLEQAITAIDCPTLVITGEQDYGNSPAMARRIAALIPAAQVEVLAGLRHMALVEDPSTVNAILLPFLTATLDGEQP
jgi:pimeloyl-ACP methyl ester carboxylesterase